MADEQKVVDQADIFQGIAVAEFEYIAQTAFQAHEDRARVSEFFLISFGTLLAAVLTTQFSGVDTRLVYRLFSILFTVVALWGALTILQLSRLRQAWLESVRAMNTMKDALIQQAPEMQDYFRWRTATMPKAYKPWSVGFLLALQVAMVSGIALGAACAIFLLMAGQSNLTWILILVSVAGMFFYLVFLYYLPLRKSKKGA